MTRTFKVSQDPMARHLQEIGERAGVLGALVQRGRIDPIVAAREIEEMVEQLHDLKIDALFHGDGPLG